MENLCNTFNQELIEIGNDLIELILTNQFSEEHKNILKDFLITLTQCENPNGYNHPIYFKLINLILLSNYINDFQISLLIKKIQIDNLFSQSCLENINSRVLTEGEQERFELINNELYLKEKINGNVIGFLENDKEKTYKKYYTIDPATRKVVKEEKIDVSKHEIPYQEQYDMEYSKEDYLKLKQELLG